MWTSLIRSGIYLVALVFLMWVLRWILDPLVGVATSGPHASAPTVQRVAGYFSALTLDNLTLIAALAVAIYLLGRAAVESKISG